jgi:hypothetical protein
MLLIICETIARLAMVGRRLQLARSHLTSESSYSLYDLHLLTALIL